MIFIKKFTSFFLSLLLNLNVLVPGNVNAESDSPKKVSCNSEITEKIKKYVKDNGFYENYDTIDKDGVKIHVATLDQFYKRDLSKDIKNDKDEKLLDFFAKKSEQITTREAMKKFAGYFGINHWLDNDGNLLGRSEEDIKAQVVKYKKAYKLGDTDVDNIVNALVRKEASELPSTRSKTLDEKSWFKPWTWASFGTTAGSMLGVGIFAGKVLVINNPWTLGGYLILTGASALVGSYLLEKEFSLNRKINNEALDISKMYKNIELAMDKFNSAMEKGSWINQNVYKYIVPDNPVCRNSPTAMFDTIEGVDKPEDDTLYDLAGDTCKRKNCENNLDECSFYLVNIVDKCRRKKKANCPRIPHNECLTLKTANLQELQKSINDEKGDL